jgi:hypothetical protein
VYHLRRQGSSVEEVAAFNLSRAHHAVHWIGIDLRLDASRSPTVRTE